MLRSLTEDAELTEVKKEESCAISKLHAEVRIERGTTCVD